MYDDFDTDDTRLEPDRLFGNLDGTLPHAAAPRIPAIPAGPALPATSLPQFHDVAAMPAPAMRDAPSETAFRPIPIPPPAPQNTLPPPSWGRSLGEKSAAAPWAPPVATPHAVAAPHAVATPPTPTTTGGPEGARLPWILLGFALGVASSVAAWLVLRF